MMKNILPKYCNAIYSRRILNLSISIFLISIFLLPFLSMPAEAALGDFLYKWGAEFRFYRPTGIAIDSNGHVYVAASNSIYVFSNIGEFIKRWGTYGSDDGQFNNPYGIAVDSSGNAYVADCGNHRIQVFSSDGTFLRKWGSHGFGDGQFFNPMGIAVDSNGNVYVADSGNRRVQVFSNSGTFLRKWGSSGTGDGQFDEPFGIALDSQNVYVVETRRVQAFSKTGTFLRKWGAYYPNGSSQIPILSGITLDSNGNVYVIDSNNWKIQVFSNTGTFLRQWGEYGFDDGQLKAGYGIVVDSIGNVYVADTWNDRVQVFDITGAFQRKWDAYDSGGGLFGGPAGIATEGSRNVFVTDAGNSRIQVFNNAGTFIRMWGRLGSGDGQFYSPSGIAMDGNGNKYVVDAGNGNINVFSNIGTFIRKWGGWGSGDGQFYFPQGIAVDGSGNVFVTDTGNGRIQVFSTTGTFIRKWGSYGSGDGQFLNPRGIIVDAVGNVYVADTWNRTVQVFSNTGTFLRKWGSYGSGNGQFLYPQGIAIDSSGNVYVTDINSVQVFTNLGVFLGSWGAYGSGDGQFKYPLGIAVDGSGKVYVADTNNYRIQVFEGLGSTDTQAPITTAAVSGTLGNNGWYVSDVSVTLTATDNDGGSGVKDIHYSLDGGAEVVVAGSSASASISGDGSHSIAYYAVDNAENKESTHPLTINIDKTPPAITASATPAPNAAGWNNTNVTVIFTCTDAISGIAACTSPITVTTEGAGQVITGTAEDYAGKTATATVTLKIDKTPPTITGSVSPAVNANGWHNTDVTVTFTCSDTLSGIASCPAPVTVTTEGAGQVISGTAVDNAGNTATASVTLNIDKTPPVLGISVSPGMLWPPNHKYVIVTPSITVTDANPGTTVKLVSVTSSESDNGLGDGDTTNDIVINADGTISLRAEQSGSGSGRIYTITYEATDIAGNATTSSATVTVPHDMR